MLKRAWKRIIRPASPATPAAAAAFMAMSTNPAVIMLRTKVMTKAVPRATPAVARRTTPQPTNVRLRKRAVPQRSARPPLPAAASPPAPIEAERSSPRRPADRWRLCSMLAAATAHVPQKIPKATNVARTGRNV